MTDDQLKIGNETKKELNRYTLIIDKLLISKLKDLKEERMTVKIKLDYKNNWFIDIPEELKLEIFKLECYVSQRLCAKIEKELKKLETKYKKL